MQELTGYSTVLWSEALEPSESVPWRPDLMRFDAKTPYEVRSKTISSWPSQYHVKPLLEADREATGRHAKHKNSKIRLAGIRPAPRPCRGTHGNQLLRLRRSIVSENE